MEDGGPPTDIDDPREGSGVLVEESGSSYHSRYFSEGAVFLAAEEVSDEEAASIEFDPISLSSDEDILTETSVAVNDENWWSAMLSESWKMCVNSF